MTGRIFNLATGVMLVVVMGITLPVLVVLSVLGGLYYVGEELNDWRTKND